MCRDGGEMRYTFVGGRHLRGIRCRWWKTSPKHPRYTLPLVEDISPEVRVWEVAPGTVVAYAGMFLPSQRSDRRSWDGFRVEVFVRVG